MSLGSKRGTAEVGQRRERGGLLKKRENWAR